MGHLGATLDSRWFTTFFLFCADTGLGTSCFGRVEFGTEKTKLYTIRRSEGHSQNICSTSYPIVGVYIRTIIRIPYVKVG